MALIALGPTDDMVLNDASCFQKLKTSIAANATDTAPSVIAKNANAPSLMHSRIPPFYDRFSY